MVTDLTAEGFIAAEELRNLFDQASSESAVIRDRLSSDGTQWIFNPPHSPHLGGKWEAAVKSTKHHLRRTITTSTLTYEEFTTLLIQVEAILNSRPLCPLTNDPQDTSALTPGHLIIGEPLMTVPEPSLQQITTDRLNRWQIITQRIQNFWEHWERECIHRYQQIYRWRQPTNEINIGSLVLITDEREPPAKWPLARVIEIHPGQDNLTRVVTLRKGHQKMQRAIHRLVPLPINADLLEDQQTESLKLIRAYIGAFIGIPIGKVIEPHPGFGSTSFGFSTPATSIPTLFGTPVTQSTGFSATTGFGPPAATGFGVATSSTNTYSTSGSAFGFGGGSTFGTAPSSSATAFGTLGVPVTTSAVGFAGFGNFGGTATTTQAPSLFSGFGSASAASTGFGNTGFGGFGTKSTTTTATTVFGGFGGALGTSTLGNFGGPLAPPQLQQQHVSNAISEALYNAVFNCQLFNDERDNTIARWNLIQALWGTGKAYYSANAIPIELTQENPLCRFKAIGYSCLPIADNNDGLVVLCFNKKEQELKDGKQQLINSITQILGNKPNLTVTVDNVKSIGEMKSQAVIYVSEKGVTGSSRKIPANELVAYLSQSIQKQQLTQMGVENIFPQVKLDPSQLKEYMENPPCSIDPRLWKQAQLDNPNAEIYIPVPMIGFQQVKYRLKCQEKETDKHRAFLDMAAERIQGLQRQHTATQAKLKEHRRTLLELQHRVLQVLVRQEITRKVGLSLQPEEEILTNRLETMHSQISAPTQFKGRISEMLSHLRMRKHVDMQSQERYSMDPIVQDDIKAYLSLQQQGMAQLIDTINTDMESLKVIKDGMADLLTGHTIS
ncbi:nuclear pore complex protein Nup54 [Diachasma alloeum]|uniref:nuclear pore complex protein Nup54 n=1 Tax=Diachasma alloeum TaxID=454923 RepID=UPI0007382C88|nr:nuclear pore complex protein Nup54 [Diachasma alloeum]